MNTCFIFCYGSLVNSKSRLGTINRETNGVPVFLTKDTGLIRTWDVNTRCKCTDHSNHKQNVLSLSKNNNKNTTVNGILIKITDEELNRLDKRETGYKRIKLSLKNFKWLDFLDKYKSEHINIFKNSSHTYVYTYIGKKSNKPTKQNPIRLRYLSLCMDGFLEYGQEFNEEFIRTVYNFPN